MRRHAKIVPTLFWTLSFAAMPVGVVAGPCDKPILRAEGRMSGWGHAPAYKEMVARRLSLRKWEQTAAELHGTSHARWANAKDARSIATSIAITPGSGAGWRAWRPPFPARLGSWATAIRCAGRMVAADMIATDVAAKTRDSEAIRIVHLQMYIASRSTTHPAPTSANTQTGGNSNRCVMPICRQPTRPGNSPRVADWRVGWAGPRECIRR